MDLQHLPFLKTTIYFTLFIYLLLKKYGKHYRLIPYLLFTDNYYI